MDEAPDLVAFRFGGQIGIERAHQAFAHHPVRRGDLVAVAVEEAGVERGDHGLVEQRIAIEPRRLGQRRVAEQRAVQPLQIDHPDGGLFDCGPGDFVADDRRDGVAEQQIEHARRGVDRGVVARRNRAAQPRRDVAVEANLTLVKPQCQPGLPTHRIAGRDLQDHRLGARAGFGVGEPYAVALAHPAGADALGFEIGNLARADRGGQPRSREITGSFDWLCLH